MSKHHLVYAIELSNGHIITGIDGADRFEIGRHHRLTGQYGVSILRATETFFSTESEAEALLVKIEQISSFDAVSRTLDAAKTQVAMPAPPRQSLSTAVKSGLAQRQRLDWATLVEQNREPVGRQKPFRGDNAARPAVVGGEWVQGPGKSQGSDG